MSETPTPEPSEPAPPKKANGSDLPRDARGRYLTRQQRQEAKAAAAAEESDEDRARRRRRRIILLLLLLLILLLICGCAGYWWRKKDNPTPAATQSPMVTASAVASPTGAATPSPSVVASPSVATSPSTAPSPSPTATAAVTIAVPNVVGKKADSAESILQAAGFTNIVFQDASGATITPSISYVVVSQTPTAGTKVTADTQLTIIVKPQTNGRG